VRQLVGAMMAKWNAGVSDVTSAPPDDDGAVQVDVLEVDGDLAGSVMPQVRTPLTSAKLIKLSKTNLYSIIEKRQTCSVSYSVAIETIRINPI